MPMGTSYTNYEESQNRRNSIEPLPDNSPTYGRFSSPEYNPSGDSLLSAMQNKSEDTPDAWNWGEDLNQDLGRLGGLLGKKLLNRRIGKKLLNRRKGRIDEGKWVLGEMLTKEGRERRALRNPPDRPEVPITGDEDDYSEVFKDLPMVGDGKYIHRDPLPSGGMNPEDFPPPSPYWGVSPSTGSSFPNSPLIDNEGVMGTPPQQYSPFEENMTEYDSPMDIGQSGSNFKPSPTVYPTESSFPNSPLIDNEGIMATPPQEDPVTLYGMNQPYDYHKQDLDFYRYRGPAESEASRSAGEPIDIGQTSGKSVLDILKYLQKNPYNPVSVGDIKSHFPQTGQILNNTPFPYIKKKSVLDSLLTKGR